LRVEQVGDGPLAVTGPELPRVAAVKQPDRGAQALPKAAEGAVDAVACPKLTRDAPDGRSCAAGGGALAGDGREPAPGAERRDQVVGKAVGQPAVLIGSARHLERQDGNGRTFRASLDAPGRSIGIQPRDFPPACRGDRSAATPASIM
jgi:hypothetical protein